MTPLKHRRDGYITIEGGPYAGETVPIDDAMLFIRSSRGVGYVYDDPSWKYKGQVFYQTARIYHHSGIERLQRGEPDATGAS